MKKKAPEVKNLSDSDLILFIRRKHREIFWEIMRRYERRLFIYLYRLVRNKEEVEDILQNVFVKVYKHIDLFDPEKKFSSWIYRIAHNEAVNFLKRRGKKQFVYWEDMQNDNKTEARSEERSPLEVWISKESGLEVRRAMKRLPERYREVLQMRYFQEKSYGEIGKAIRKPVNTVGTLINRAKKKLFQVIGEKK